MSDSTTICDPVARSHTALFVLLGSLSSGVMLKRTRSIDYPVNRAGQNSVECYTLAMLVFILLTGFFAGAIGEFLGSHVWSFALALPLGSLLTFVVLHLLFFGFAFLYRCLKSIHFFSPGAPEQLPVGVYLSFFTLFAGALMFTGNPVLIVAAIPWLIWAAMNTLAGLILFAGGFLSQLSGESE